MITPPDALTTLLTNQGNILVLEYIDYIACLNRINSHYSKEHIVLYILRAPEYDLCTTTVIQTLAIVFRL